MAVEAERIAEKSKRWSVEPSVLGAFLGAARAGERMRAMLAVVVLGLAAVKAQTTVEDMDEQGAEGTRMVAATVVVVGLVGAAMVGAERGEEMGTADEATAEATGVVAEQEGGGLEMAVEVLVLAQLAR